MSLEVVKPLPTPKSLLEDHLARNPQAVVVISEVNGQVSYSVSNMPQSQFYFFMALLERHGRQLAEKFFEPKKEVENAL